MERSLSRYVRWSKSVGHSPHTYETHRRYIQYFIDWCKAKDYSTDINDLHIEMVREFIEEMQERGLSDYTVATRVRSLRAFTHWLTIEEWLAKDPLARLKPPKVADAPKETLAPADVDRILATCDKSTLTGLRDIAVILTLYSTGIRVSELAALQQDDIDYNRGLILIRKGKGGKFRVVPLGSKLDKAIDRYLSRRTDGHPALFLTDEGQPMRYVAIRQMLRRKSHKVGIHLHPHLFRHTFAVQYLRNGGKLETLKTIMGHTTYEMTLHYARIAAIDISESHETADPARSLKSK